MAKIYMLFKKNQPLFLAVAFFCMALIVYSGTNQRLVAPPFGDIIGQDFRQVIRAAAEMKQGQSPYVHAIEFGKNPNFAEFMWWTASTFPYPPIVGVAFIPLLAMDVEQAVVLWTILNWLLILVSAVLIVKAFPFENKPATWQYIVFAVVFIVIYAPLHIALKLVQLDILLFFLLILTYWLHRRESLVAAVTLAIAIAIKPILAPMLFFFIWKRQWKMAFLCVAITAPLIVAGFVYSGWNLLPDYLEVNKLWSTGGMLSYPFNQSINGLVIRLFTDNIYMKPLLLLPGLAGILRYGSMLVAIMLWLWLVSRKDNRSSPTDFVEYGFTVTTLQIISPLVDDCHYVWTLIPLMIILFTWLDTDKKETHKQMLFMLTLLVAIYLAQPDLHDAIYRGWDTLAYAGKLVASNNGLFTGAYVYGLIALEFCIAVFLALHKKINSLTSPNTVN